MKRRFNETIDGSIKNIIQLKTVNNSLEWSQMYDALEDCPVEFINKLIQTLNSLGETMGVDPTQTFDKVLCNVNDDNEETRKKMYNWWRGVFEVLGSCKNSIPKDRQDEFNQKVDALMAEILKSGDGQNTAEEEPEEEKGEEGAEGQVMLEEEYEPADKEDETNMLTDMKWAVGKIGEIANRVQELINFVNPYCEVNESMMNNKPARYSIGDHVLYNGEECVVTDIDEDLRNDEEIYQVSRDSDKVRGLSFNEWATSEELELINGFEKEDKSNMKKKTIWKEIRQTSQDDWVDAGEVFEMAKESDLENELKKGDDGWTEIGQPVGESDSIVTPKMKKKVEEYVTFAWRKKTGGDIRGMSDRDMFDLRKLFNSNHIKVSYGGVLDDDSIRIDGEKVGEVVRNYSSKKVNGEYKELRPKIQWLDGGMVNEASVVVDANDVWEVLDLLSDEKANKNLTDLINSHVRTEEEIMDAINSYVDVNWHGKVRKADLEKIFTDWMYLIVGDLGLDVDKYREDGQFVDPKKPVALEGSEDEQKPDEVKDGEKQVTQGGETKTLVAGEDSNKPVCEMTIEQEIDNPWKLAELLWGQGKENLEDLLRSELVGEEEIMQLLEDMEVRNLTNINDLFAFDFPSVLDSLGLDPEAWSQNLEFVKRA